MIIDTNVQDSFFDGSIRIFGKDFEFSGDIVTHREYENYYDGDRGTHTESISYTEAIVTSVTGHILQDAAIQELIQQDALNCHEWGF